MESSNPYISLLIGLLLVSFLTAALSQYFTGTEDPNKFSGVLLENPVTDGRYKSTNLNGKRVFFSRYFKLEQGDYIELDFRTCEYNEKYNSYDKCEILIDDSKQNQFLKQILSLRNTIISNTKLRLPSHHDVLVLAMTIGYEDDLPESLTEKLREIGAIHMLVVSGYNVSLVLNSSAVLLMRFPRWIYITSSVFLLLLFILLTGFDAPIVRSVIMGIFIVVSKAYSRPAMALYLLILSAIVMVSWDLTYLSNISFQLSFSATFGVIVFGSLFASSTGTGKSSNNFVSDLVASIGASVFVLPIISFYFGTLSFLGIASSILLGWMVPLITYLGFLTFALDWAPLKFLFVTIIDLFFIIADFIAYFSFLNPEHKLHIKELVLYYIFVGMAILFVFKVKRGMTSE